MSSRGLEMGIVFVLVVVLWGGAMAQSNCTNAISSLASCVNYIMGNSSNPSSSCCSQISNVVQQSPQCLCSVLSGGPSLGITINQTLSLPLPGACQVQTPLITQCKAASGPKTSAISPAGPPAISPSDSPNETPDPEITPSTSVVPSGNGGNAGAGSKTVPTTGGTSDGSIIRSPSQFVLFLLLHTASASIVLNF